ncbi:MAG: hypothetical protein GC160_04110 [Acidobacteria bacterium]|nr:hypothetical protein [Acidobacteriota bacterium]
MPLDQQVLAHYERFGSVTRCSHGCVHLQLGQMSLSLTAEQYLRFVAMVSESAANFEFFRSALTESEQDDRDETA